MLLDRSTLGPGPTACTYYPATHPAAIIGATTEPIGAAP